MVPGNCDAHKLAAIRGGWHGPENERITLPFTLSSAATIERRDGWYRRDIAVRLRLRAAAGR